jgi:hypothetical protein
MSKHHDDIGGLPEIYIALAEMVVRTVWSLAYGVALVIVGMIQAVLDAHRGQGR